MVWKIVLHLKKQFKCRIRKTLKLGVKTAEKEIKELFFSGKTKITERK